MPHSPSLFGPEPGDDASVSLDLDLLNPDQLDAVLHRDGPQLVVAGAGSGKTRVLTHRIAHLMHEGVHPSSILAITFTNKAASEMAERVNGLLGRHATGMWVMTFHAACARILRADAARIGFRPSFSIYDSADQVRLVRSIIEDETRVLPTATSEPQPGRLANRYEIAAAR